MHATDETAAFAGLDRNGLAALHLRIAPPAFGAARPASAPGATWTGCWGASSAEMVGTWPRRWGRAGDKGYSVS
jgi:hypothetical protein